MEIEYHPWKKNLADSFSWYCDYMDAANNKEEKTLHTVGYVTWGSIKCKEAQKMIENARQATQQSKVISKANNKSKSYLTDNESLLYNTVDDRIETSFTEGSNVLNSNLIKTRKAFSKRKRKKSTKQAKRVLPKKRKKKKLDETSLDSQPIRLHFMTHNDKMAHINRETVKKISKKELTFVSPLLKIH